MKLQQQERKRDKIKVVDSSLNIDEKQLSRLYQCIHCKERNYLQETKDTAHLRCSNCGGLTPLRTAKHSRGLAAPAIQQENYMLSTIVQAKNYGVGNRKPQSINDRDKTENPLERYLLEKGYNITDIQYDEPGEPPT